MLILLLLLLLLLFLSYLLFLTLVLILFPTFVSHCWAPFRLHSSFRREEHTLSNLRAYYARLRQRRQIGEFLTEGGANDRSVRKGNVTRMVGFWPTAGHGTLILPIVGRMSAS